MADIVGWIATAIMAVGSIDIAHKRVRGLWLMLLGNVGWAAAGFLTGLYSLIGVSVVMGLLDLYGILKWSDNETRKETCGSFPKLYRGVSGERVLSGGRHGERVGDDQQGLRIWEAPETD